MSKEYLRATGPESFQWVERLEEATTDDKQSANATLKQLKNAELVEVPRPAGMASKWAIVRGK